MGEPRVLVIEPSAGLRALIRSTLEAEGYVVRDAADGGAALAERARFVPDVILQDLSLPDMTGLDLTRRLRAEPGGEAIPILAISGFLGGAQAMRIAAAGFSALLLKPIDLGRVIQAVNARVPSRTAQPDVGKGRRVLLVDSDQIQLRLLSYQMEAAGFQVTTASTAESALQAAQADPPQAVVSEVSMPGMDGFELCLQLRRTGVLSRVPVLLLSVQNIEPGDQELARQVSATRLLPRPLRSRGLVDAVLEVLSQDLPPLPADDVSTLGRVQALRANRELGRQVSLNSDLAQRSAIQAAQLSLLGGMANALTRGGGVDTVLDELLPECLDAAGISKGALYLADDADPARGFRLRPIVGFGDRDRAGLADLFGCLPLLRQVVTTGTALRIPSPTVPRDVTRRVLAGAGAGTMILSPLGFETRPIGALLAASERRAENGSAPLAFIRALGGQIGQALALGNAFTELTGALQVRDDFMTVAAHELRTPLTSARLHVQSMLRTLGTGGTAAHPPTDFPDRIRALGRQLGRLEEMMDQLLDAGRMSHGAHHPERTRFDLVASVRATVEALRDEHQDATEIVVDHDGPVLGRWDPVALQTVVRNLVANALKFSGKQPVRVAVHADADRAVLTVTDKGIGISLQDQTRIFEKFERAVATHNYGGWGVGLWLVRRHVEAHHGTIDVDSRINHGTTFTVTLPRDLPPDAVEQRGARWRTDDSTSLSQ